MKRVDFNVRSDYEFVTNYKELQQAFNKIGVDRAFNVGQLSKGKRQDSLEFFQWFKGYWDHVTGGQDVGAEYDAIARRQLCKTRDWKKFSLGVGAGAGGVGSRGAAASRSTSVSNDSAPIAAVRTRPTTATNTANTGTASLSKAGIKSALRPTPTPTPGLATKVHELTEQITELKLKVEIAERERDFYFDKLRDIEILCQAPELADVPVLRTVEKVLYAADTEEAKAAMMEAQEEYGAALVVAVAAEGEEEVAEGDAQPPAEHTTAPVVAVGE